MNTGAMIPVGESRIPTYAPPGVRRITPIWSDSIEAIADWTAANGADSLDTTNVLTSTLITGTPASVKLTAEAGLNATMFLTLGAALDWSANIPHFMVRFYIPESEYTKIDLIKLQFGNTAADKFWAAILWDDSSASATPGWNEICVTDQVASTRTAGWDWTDVKYVYMVLRAEAGETPAVTFDYVEAYQKLPVPLVAVTFDDMVDDQFIAAQYAASQGIPLTIFIAQSISGNGLGATGKLTLAQVQEMRRMGHLIANHGWSHSANWQYPVALGAFGESEAGQAIELQANFMARNGMPEGARGAFAPPFGGWITNGDESLINRYVDCVRQTWGAKGVSLGAPSSVRNRPIYQIGAVDKASGGDETTHTDLDDNAIADGAIAVHLFHDIDGTGDFFSLAEFKTYIDALVAHRDAGDCKIVTMGDMNREVFVEEVSVPLTISAADDADGTATVTIQVKDTNGGVASGRATVRTWTSGRGGADMGVPVAIATSYDVTTGTEIQQIIAEGDRILLADASGTIVMSADDDQDGTLWFMAEYQGVVYSDSVLVSGD